MLPTSAISLELIRIEIKLLDNFDVSRWEPLGLGSHGLVLIHTVVAVSTLHVETLRTLLNGFFIESILLWGPTVQYSTVLFNSLGYCSLVSTYRTSSAVVIRRPFLYRLKIHHEKFVW